MNVSAILAVLRVAIGSSFALQPASPANVGDCAKPIPVYESGQIIGTVCPQDAQARGLTVVDLGDAWMPRVLLGDASQVQANAYRETWLKLATGDLNIVGFAREAQHDRFFEPFGIVPAFSQVKRRLTNDALHACHAAVDTTALRARIEGKTVSTQQAEERPATARHLGQAEVRALQQHLLCENLIVKREVTGTLDPKTKTALGIYRRKHLLLSTKENDRETLQTLLTDNLELEFRAGLRALRERVVDATGLIEDGSALLAVGKVLGRELNPPTWHQSRGWQAAARGAPDRISPATEAAAQALGWLTPHAMVEFLDRGVPEQVALHLPALPAYYHTHMELRVEIDRGTLGARGQQAPGQERLEDPSVRRPTMTVWARDEQGEIALVRWPTTVGGWKKERLGSGKIVWRFKESPTGEFFWRDLVAAPVWYPPASTPDAELVHEHLPGRFRLRDSLIGPGYRSAYGLVMLVQHKVVRVGKKDYWVDTLVRAHGSVDYRSLQNGASHGCHRLFNHLALRLGGFLLAHRHWQQLGPLREVYSKAFEWHGKTYGIYRASQGDGYRLDPPISVVVHDGQARVPTSQQAGGAPALAQP